MIVSHAWLGKYFKEKIPSADALAELFSAHAFEVEEVIKKDDDALLDLKILPDRAHYALSHLGVAREIAAITGLTFKQEQTVLVPENTLPELSVSVKESSLCLRYCARRAAAVHVAKSPQGVAARLNAVGQRSINTLVDAVNFVMLDIGQPLHVFDADKVKGAIVVRLAKAGETLELLPEKATEGSKENVRTITLAGTELVIADDEGILALAGVKGGRRAAVSEKTENIIIEAANFDPVSIRKTSTLHNLRNDSSKRFENQITSELAREAMDAVSALIHEHSPHAVFGAVVDIYSHPEVPKRITTTPEYISSLLGVSISIDEIITILSRMNISVTRVEELLTCVIPAWRLDITIPQDIAEEVGRIYGYDRIPPALPPKLQNHTKNPVFYGIENIKDILVRHGFNEVYTYTLGPVGDVELHNPLASDKGRLRSRLREGLESALESNAKNVPLLSSDEIKIFEIGTVFAADLTEKIVLGIGMCITKSVKNAAEKQWAALEELVKTIGDEIGAPLEGLMESSEHGTVFECDIVSCINTKENAPTPTFTTPSHATLFKPISAYPFVLRDIAVFVPESETEASPLSIVQKEAGELLVRHALFDVFKKTFPDGTKKTSYAFRLVFQSAERTLNDAEVGGIMERITTTMNNISGWQVR